MDLKVYVNEELWEFRVSEEEFQAAISGDEEVLKRLVVRESERRSIAMIAEEQNISANILQADKLRESTDISQTNETKETFVWPDKAVFLFLETYRDKEPEFTAGTKRHNKIWADIAVEMKKANYNISASQCQNKMSGLKRTYKNITDNNKKSGNHASSWAFYSIMDSLFGEKKWIVPVAVASSDGPSSPNSVSCSSLHNSDEEPKRKKRRLESLLESFIGEMKNDKQKKREERDQRRAEKDDRWKQNREEKRQMHEERVQLQRSLIELLEKIADRK